jgi:hypothetical protein
LTLIFFPSDNDCDFFSFLQIKDFVFAIFLSQRLCLYNFFCAQNKQQLTVICVSTTNCFVKATPMDQKEAKDAKEHISTTANDRVSYADLRQFASLPCSERLKGHTIPTIVQTKPNGSYLPGQTCMNSRYVIAASALPPNEWESTHRKALDVFKKETFMEKKMRIARQTAAVCLSSDRQRPPFRTAALRPRSFRTSTNGRATPRVAASRHAPACSPTVGRR